MDPVQFQQVQAWSVQMRRAIYTMRGADVGPVQAIEVSERLYEMLQDYLIETADILGRDVTDGSGTLTFMQIPVIPDPNLPFEFEPLADQPVIVGEMAPVPASVDLAAECRLVRETLRDLERADALGTYPFVIPAKDLPADGLVQIAFQVLQPRPFFVMSLDR